MSGFSDEARKFVSTNPPRGPETNDWRDRLIAALLAWAIGSVFFLWLAFYLGREAGRVDVIHMAVEYGNAEYYIDSNFNKAWRWKEGE